MLVHVVIDSGPWPAIAAIGTWAATIAAGIAAYVAWRSVQSQLRDADRRHREALEASARPFLTVTGMTFDRADRRFRPTATLENIGPGPARNVTVDVWCFQEAAPGRRIGTLPQDIIPTAAAERAARRPDLRAIPGSIGPGREKTLEFGPLTRQLSLELQPGKQLLLPGTSTPSMHLSRCARTPVSPRSATPPGNSLGGTRRTM